LFENPFVSSNVAICEPQVYASVLIISMC